MVVVIPRRVLRLREYVVVEASRLDAMQCLDQVPQLSYRSYNGLPWDIVERLVTSVLECSHCHAVSIIYLKTCNLCGLMVMNNFVFIFFSFYILFVFIFFSLESIFPI